MDVHEYGVGRMELVRLELPAVNAVMRGVSNATGNSCWASTCLGVLALTYVSFECAGTFNDGSLHERLHDLRNHMASHVVRGAGLRFAIGMMEFIQRQYPDMFGGGYEDACGLFAALVNTIKDECWARGGVGTMMPFDYYKNHYVFCQSCGFQQVAAQPRVMESAVICQLFVKPRKSMYTAQDLVVGVLNGRVDEDYNAWCEDCGGNQPSTMIHCPSNDMPPDMFFLLVYRMGDDGVRRRDRISTVDGVTVFGRKYRVRGVCTHEDYTNAYGHPVKHWKSGVVVDDGRLAVLDDHDVSFEVPGTVGYSDVMECASIFVFHADFRPVVNAAVDVVTGAAVSPAVDVVAGAVVSPDVHAGAAVSPAVDVVAGAAVSPDVHAGAAVSPGVHSGVSSCSWSTVSGRRCKRGVGLVGVGGSVRRSTVM